jgi:hypothetical protein
MRATATPRVAGAWQHDRPAIPAFMFDDASSIVDDNTMR